MNKNSKLQKLLTLIVLAALVLSACKPNTEKKDSSTDSEPANSDNSAAAENSMRMDISLLDDAIEVPEGGFTFRPH